MDDNYSAPSVILIVGEMISEQLQKKIDFAIKLLQTIPSDDVEVCFSGGKDSSVILQLAKMSGIKFTAIYKNTTIDPKGNVAFCKNQGCEAIRPKKTFFELIAERGFPTRRARFCCEVLKEYKIKEHAIIGVRKDESGSRDKRYQEPQQCRAYGNSGKAKKDRSNVCQHYYPILTWNNQDVHDFLEFYQVDVNPLYTYNYNGGGYLDTSRRLGCMCCPVKSQGKQLKEFEQNPKFVRLWIRAGLKWWNKPRKKEISSKFKFGTVYDLFFHNLFCDSYDDYCYKVGVNGMFEQADCKKFLEEYFKIKLD